MIVSEFQERELITLVLVGLGVRAREAAAQADLLVEADLRGHPSHGLQRLPVLTRRLKAGLIQPASQGNSTWISQVVLRVDGERGLGPVVALNAIDVIVERARTTGMAMAAVRNNNHLGMLGYYVEKIARLGQIGLALTTGESMVHPWGGREPMLGANPIAIGVPTDAEPFIVDMATSVVSMGQVLEYQWRGEELPYGWALDTAGHPTRDPAAAFLGSLAPFGGFKGYALGLALGLVVSVITGGAIGPEVKGTLDATHASNKGDLFLCIDPKLVGSPEAITTIVGMYLDAIRESPPQQGLDQVTIPGDRSRAMRKERLQNGIPIADAVWAECETLLPNG